MVRSWGETIFIWFFYPKKCQKCCFWTFLGLLVNFETLWGSILMLSLQKSFGIRYPHYIRVPQKEKINKLGPSLTPPPLCPLCTVGHFEGSGGGFVKSDICKGLWHSNTYIRICYDILRHTWTYLRHKNPRKCSFQPKSSKIFNFLTISTSKFGLF